VVVVVGMVVVVEVVVVVVVVSPPPLLPLPPLAANAGVPAIALASKRSTATKVMLRMRFLTAIARTSLFCV
jgi:hypothetical protein